MLKNLNVVADKDTSIGVLKEAFVQQKLSISGNSRVLLNRKNPQVTAVYLNKLSIKVEDPVELLVPNAELSASLIPLQQVVPVVLA